MRSSVDDPKNGHDDYAGAVVICGHGWLAVTPPGPRGEVLVDGAFMQFHLTYEGVLYGSGRDDPRPDHKHELRRVFHQQLKVLWDGTWLNEMKHGSYVNAPTIDPSLPMREGLAQRYKRGNYRFVPLVREELALLCSLEILFLRPDLPGNLIKSADLDSRLKTLFDALTVPINTGQLGKYGNPGDGEDPFYCLLEDDKLISHVAVETDRLLEPTKDGLAKNQAKNDARLVIDVKVRPYQLTMGNIGFGT
jgi:hypothetical protein